ncbi:hypothetical protein BS47DRAFT_1396224 [Hydnum rufescens UP504]|uniref:Uncharacterized protein n=1 Tax=Hydnum rufescens UP504 TaxID=1448309 RepID=A0A9P6AQG1_9AGAM|nr:hypothetical protein BS47DRAFT_1396224 [Hydnum rufescens UP504]
MAEVSSTMCAIGLFNIASLTTESEPEFSTRLMTTPLDCDEIHIQGATQFFIKRQSSPGQNPEWVFQCSKPRSRSFTLTAMTLLGPLPPAWSSSNIEELLAEVPIPEHPGSIHTTSRAWVLAAVHALISSKALKLEHDPALMWACAFREACSHVPINYTIPIPVLHETDQMVDLSYIQLLQENLRTSFPPVPQQ